MTFTIHFPDPGFFLADVTVRITVDGELFYDGGFKGGFDVPLDLEPGPHTLETAIHLSETIARRRTYPLALTPDGPTRATLRYSRFWGNFTKKLTLS